MKMILNSMYENCSNGKKSFAVLLDPDKLNLDILQEKIDAINSATVDYIFVGGTIIGTDFMDTLLLQLQEKTFVPKIIFPGNGLHINNKADGILYLSLISGRNPEFLIGQHVVSAPILKRSKLEILSTGYILVDGGKPTTASYISNTAPLPNDKPEIAVATAVAGEMLGLKLIYLDSGSGAQIPVSESIIQAVKKHTDTPLIVGGGINSLQKASKALAAGADIIVVGNAIEENPNFLFEMASLVNSYNHSVA
ncbi:geranylgeranylglyceryl/heptaprenylglyceryl phosphate synthase [Lacihabitans sp. CS3-21]|uniref:geranylgeranylglyceryl/heptaprenylglyceryl phosphate synthase n=1 Tax=Lacihabitans sp. CS3-21 TaxID=2487332 RepID=UPI00286DDDC2|nr:geranylgeranylglyceryl/heptaprenylglyceryl phosphate synthase [Lacihabitans sp. CS3-21]